LKIKDKSCLAKSRVYVNPVKEEDKTIKNEYILVLLCGDDDVNETKLQNVIGANVRPAHPEELLEITGADAGSIGPIGLKYDSIRIIADKLLEDADEVISGANKNDYHIRNIDLKRDVKTVEYHDLRTVKAGELSPDRKSSLKVTKAIEVGHIFKLGTKYAEALGAKYLNQNGKEQTLVMGSYGIGIERIAASYIEQNHDENGIIWSGEIAPFKVHLICVNTKSLEIKKLADNLYTGLCAENCEVLYDDREDVSAGSKFNDADLIGIPVQITVSDRNLRDGAVELKVRRTGERKRIKISDFSRAIAEYLNNI
jgi:prolyl-tRNA synthetase